LNAFELIVITLIASKRNQVMALRSTRTLKGSLNFIRVVFHRERVLLVKIKKWKKYYNDYRK